MPDIFISYRRDDSAATTGRIRDHLAVAFGEGPIFRDVDGISPGADFRKRIKSVLPQCAVCLVIIGTHWLDIKDQTGTRRLDANDDPVRTEVELALRLRKWGLTVIPVLVDGTRMPSRAALPPSIRELADLNASNIRYDPEFKSDMQLVITALDTLIKSVPVDQRPISRLNSLDEWDNDIEPWTDVVELRSYPESVKSGVNEPEEIQVTAYYPLDVAPGAWQTMLLYVHAGNALYAVRSDAETELGPRGNLRPRFYPRIPSKGSPQVGDGVTLTAELTGPGISTASDSAPLIQTGALRRASLQFKADQALVGKATTGEIGVSAEGSQIASISAPLLCFAIPGRQPGERTSVAAHLYERVYLCYSHQDAPIVEMARRSLEALGVQTAIDHGSLKAGEYWQRSLQEAIQSADVFQLFWSENAASSRSVEQEWQYALSLNRGAGFIRPVYWKTPLPSPPAPLAHFHFAFVPLLSSGAADSSSAAPKQGTSARSSFWGRLRGRS